MSKRKASQQTVGLLPVGSHCVALEVGRPTCGPPTSRWANGLRVNGFRANGFRVAHQTSLGREVFCSGEFNQIKVKDIQMQCEVSVFFLKC